MPTSWNLQPRSAAWCCWPWLRRGASRRRRGALTERNRRSAMRSTRSRRSSGSRCSIAGRPAGHSNWRRRGDRIGSSSGRSRGGNVPGAGQGAVRGLRGRSVAGRRLDISRRSADGALKRFNGRFPTVPMRLLGEAFGEVERLVRSGKWSLGIGVGNQLEQTGLQQIDIEAVRMIPVRRGRPSSRPRNAAGGRAPRASTSSSSCRSTSARRRPDHGVVGASIWRVGDLGVKHALLLAGLGWAGCRSRPCASTSRPDAGEAQSPRLAGRRISAAGGATRSTSAARAGGTLADRAAGRAERCLARSSVAIGS